jgi:hypothetical protein
VSLFNKVRNLLTLKKTGNFLPAEQLLACQEQQSIDLVTIYNTLFYSNPLPKVELC